MSQERSLATQRADTDRDSAALLEKVLMAGDLGTLSPAERLAYIKRICEALGLNPYTRPFEYLKLQGKLVLYARKDATEQLRKLHGISIETPLITYTDDLVIVTVTARDASGRTDGDLGAVALGTLTGEARANAIMKALTKAKRRATLSICGLGMLDETEIETIPGAVSLDDVTHPVSGDLIEERTPRRLSPAQADAGRRSAALVTEQRQAAASGQTRAQAMEPTPPEIMERWKTIRELQAAIPNFDSERFNAALPKKLTRMDAAELDAVIAQLREKAAPVATEDAESPPEASTEATQPPAPDAERRRKLNDYVDGVTTILERVKSSRGPLKPDQIEALSTVYERGCLLVSGAVTRPATTVDPKELVGLIAGLRAKAGDELRVGETPPPTDESEAF